VQILSASKKVLSRFPAGQALRVPRGILKPGQRYLWRVWPYFGPKRGYPARPLAVSYLDTLAARPASGAAARGGRPT